MRRIILGKLAQQAKAFVDERGGTEALGAEAKKLQDIVKGKGSISDKAKEAAATAQAFAKQPAPDPPAAADEPTAPARATPTQPVSTEPPAFED